MLVFVVPLKSASVARSWAWVSRLAERTLRAACAQTHPAFRVIVACHELPAIGFSDPRLEFVQVDSPKPVSTERTETRRDKGSKLLTGLRRALEHHPTHIMMLDADDCVSNRLAAHVAEHSSANGWYISRGYFWREGDNEVHVERRRFHQWCGSSHILRPDLLDIPQDDVPGWYLPHGPIARQLRERGTPLKPLPFPGAVYLVSHGENLNDYGHVLWPRNPVKHWLRRLLYHRPLTPAMRAEFGLQPIAAADRGTAAG